MLKISFLLTTLFSILVTASSAFASEYKIGDLTLEAPIARATPPAAKVAAGYLIIANDGQEPDRLVGGSASFAANVEIHEMKMGGQDNSVMMMSEVEGGLALAPGSKTKLKPGGYHIMFTGLKEQLTEGEKRSVKLTFNKAGTVEVEFHVKSIAETMKLKHSH